MKALAAALILMSVAATGCTTTHISSVETGILENDAEKLESVYDSMEQKKLSGETLTKSEVECMGFDLSAPNVEFVPGIFALKRIFGDAAFQDANGVDHSSACLKDSEAYHGYWIPYQQIETTEDRIYLSEAEVFEKGKLVYIFLIFKDDKLCYSEIRRTYFSTYFSHYALFEGLITAMKSPGKAALSIMEKLQEYEKPGLQYFVPIPIP